MAFAQADIIIISQRASIFYVNHHPLTLKTIASPIRYTRAKGNVSQMLSREHDISHIHTYVCIFVYSKCSGHANQIIFKSNQTKNQLTNQLDLWLDPISKQFHLV
jgi:phage terminase Nu1 subunit (DNA packaging protein)